MARARKIKNLAVEPDPEPMDNKSKRTQVAHVLESARETKRLAHRYLKHDDPGADDILEHLRLAERLLAALAQETRRRKPTVTREPSRTPVLAG